MYLQTEEDLVTAFGICHIIGMSSAVTNPILYGFLNKNFRKVEIVRFLNTNQTFGFDAN